MKPSTPQIYYQSRQWVTMLWLILPALTLLTVWFEMRDQNSEALLRALLLVMLINLFVLCCFGSLNIQLDDAGVHWQFGFFGWPKWNLAWTEIAHVEVCETQRFESRGIRLTREGMLYNASGKGTVRITKADGSKIRLGTAEPEALCAQLHHQILHQQLLNQ